MAALNLTIDKAPTRPNDNASENLITVITKVVIRASGIKVSEKYDLSFKDLPTLTYVNLTKNDKIKDKTIA